MHISCHLNYDGRAHFIPGFTGHNFTGERRLACDSRMCKERHAAREMDPPIWVHGALPASRLEITKESLLFGAQSLRVRDNIVPGPDAKFGHVGIHQRVRNPLEKDVGHADLDSVEPPGC